MRGFLLAFAVILASLMGPASAAAHGMRTAYLEIVETSPSAVVATLKLTVADPLVSPRFPEGCTVETADTSANTRSYVLGCDGPLAGRAIGIEGLGPILTEAVVRVSLHDGASASTVLTAERPSLLIPRRMSALAVARQYVRLGIEHILTGPDHLLFLLALVLYLKRWRAVLAAETAFTVSHSISFSATALGLVHVASAAAEACIALSLLLLAAEVVRFRDETPSAASGALSALIFGLVHGLGFAGGLGEIGVPDDAVSVTLTGFGLGVEIGQIAFLAVVLLAVAGIKRLVPRPHLGLTGGYGVGVAGAFWLIERLWVCFA
jgi:hydrogenase/urease accessory protein HupE